MVGRNEAPTGLFIGGEWRPSGQSIAVTNPATGDVVREVADAGPDHWDEALGAAHTAQSEWAAVAPRSRAVLLKQFIREVEDRADLLRQVIVEESGKPAAEASGEVGMTVETLSWFMEQAAHVHGTFAPSSAGGFRIATLHQPVGPSLLISPWNFPLAMMARKAGAALAAGCTVIMKPAAETPAACAVLVEAAAEAGLPPGVVNLLHTSQPEAMSRHLMADTRLKKVSFTGSTRGGRQILAQAADNVMNASMELGGDGPFVVLSDADVDLAVENAMTAKFRNAGQACVAANRIVLDSAIADEFTEKFLAKVGELQVGNGADAGVSVGPMISTAQLERARGLRDDLLAAGAVLLAGGDDVDGPGYFFSPTVMRASPSGAAVCKEELFAPLAVLYTVDSVHDMISFANDSDYGLAAYVFTRDLSKAMLMSERLEFGMVGVNRGVIADPAAPFGGLKHSGIGREVGHRGVYEFLEEKYIALTVADDCFG